MGTRALIKVYEGSELIVTIYNQFDGYPTGLGHTIKEILAFGRSRLISGYTTDNHSPSYFNGMGCLAAYLVGELKRGRIGNVYLAPSDDMDDIEYVYTINHYDDDGINITTENVYEKTTVTTSLAEYNPSDVEDKLNSLQDEEEPETEEEKETRASIAAAIASSDWPGEKVGTSSVIKTAMYDWPSEDCIIEFVNGKKYVYHSVPNSVYLGLITSGSKGAFFNRNIKGQYDSEGL